MVVVIQVCILNTVLNQSENLVPILYKYTECHNQNGIYWLPSNKNGVLMLRECPVSFACLIFF